jgi:hypothetical protein
MPEVEIRFASDREYERLRQIRDKYGVQWRGMLIQGAHHLEGRRVLRQRSRAIEGQESDPMGVGRRIVEGSRQRDANADAVDESSYGHGSGSK